MNTTNNPFNEQISSLADGGLVAAERAQVVQNLLASADGMQTWHRYHVVGDVLRSAELAPSGDDHAFWRRLSQTLVLEPLYPDARTHVDAAVAGAVIAIAPTAPSTVSANDSVWRWRLLAGVSTAALLIVVGLGLAPVVAPQGDARIAMVTAPVPPPDFQVVDSSQGAMLRDPHLDQLMAAHQQWGGHSALQVPAGFLRNATYEGAR